MTPLDSGSFDSSSSSRNSSRCRATPGERAWSWTLRAKRSFSNTRFGTRFDDIEQPSAGSSDFDDDEFTSLPTETSTEYGTHGLGPIRLPNSTRRRHGSLRLHYQISPLVRKFARTTADIARHIISSLRHKMFLVIFLLLLGVYVHYLWRAEATINVPWVPDPASRLFTQSPLTPLPAKADITTYQLPLRTKGRNVVDANGRRFKLLSVNWYGASDELFVPGGLDVRHRRDIALTIRALGFNSVRLPYADELVTANPIVAARVVAANPDLAGRRALDVFEAVATALTDAGLAVVVNNHITHATWCCGADPCDAGWANDHLGPLCRVRQTEEGWVRNWEVVMARFVGNPGVIGADLRNEVRGVWGTMPWTKWAAAAERAGNRLLRMNPDWLVVVGGTESGNDLRGVAERPLRLDVPDRVVYSAHVYAWSGWGSLEGRFSKRGYASFVSTMRENWGYLVEGNKAPVWVGEFGAPRDPSMGDANYWQNLVRYLKVVDADFGYWAINPRKPKGNTTETYALVEDDWETPVLDYRMKDMAEMMRPGISREHDET